VTVMGSTERRIACLRIAASQLKRFDKTEKAPSANQLLEYADRLSAWAYRGERINEGSDG
jgi:hypothetical protein